MSIAYSLLMAMCVALVKCQGYSSGCGVANPQSPEDCTKYHKYNTPCCYQEFYSVASVNIKSCVPVLPYQAMTGIVYQDDEYTTFRNCGEYTMQFPNSTANSCGVWIPFVLEDCHQFSDLTSYCCMLTEATNVQVTRSCFYSGNLINQQYHNYYNGVYYEVQCEAGKMRVLLLAYFVLSFILII